MNLLNGFYIFRHLTLMEILVFLILSSVLLLMTGNRFLQAHSECNVVKRQAFLNQSLNSVLLHNLCETGEEVQHLTLENLDNGPHINAWYYNPEARRLTHLFNTEMDKQNKPPLVTRYLNSVRIPSFIFKMRGSQGHIHETPAPLYIFGDAYPRVHLFGGQFSRVLNAEEWKHPERPYRAVIAGPLIDAKAETIFVSGVTPEPTITLFDPSNGVSSHGYLIQTAPGFRVQNVATREKHLITAQLK